MKGHICKVFVKLPRSSDGADLHCLNKLAARQDIREDDNPVARLNQILPLQLFYGALNGNLRVI